eukprot:3940236-Rhodomonas_salina.3
MSVPDTAYGARRAIAVPAEVGHNMRYISTGLGHTPAQCRFTVAAYTSSVPFYHSSIRQLSTHTLAQYRFTVAAYASSVPCYHSTARRTRMSVPPYARPVADIA